ncbi:MAG: CBS domain-containing protein [Gammaproteobacteria bacterium]|nr:CBS domain-containing protein [Gammaproteobacteria bacterium]
MSAKFSPLDFHSMPVGAGYSRPEQEFPGGMTVDSPALGAMTDLRRITALTVERTNTLAATRERMKKLGVRMLLVTDGTGAVMGIVTVTDLDSGRPEKIAAKTGEDPAELLVQDIMTLRGRIEVLTLDEVSGANVGQVLSSLRAAGRRHALVLDQACNAICGIFSLTRLCGQIGLDIQPGAATKAIESALATVLD